MRSAASCGWAQLSVGVPARASLRHPVVRVVRAWGTAAVAACGVAAAVGVCGIGSQTKVAHCFGNWQDSVGTHHARVISGELVANRIRDAVAVSTAELRRVHGIVRSE